MGRTTQLVIDAAKQTAWEYDSGSDPVGIKSDGVLHAGALSVKLSDLFPPEQDTPTSL
jgi:hypothetical protein